jgi:hypothetical protein
LDGSLPSFDQVGFGFASEFDYGPYAINHIMPFVSVCIVKYWQKYEKYVSKLLIVHSSFRKIYRNPIYTETVSQPGLNFTQTTYSCHKPPRWFLTNLPESRIR